MVGRGSELTTLDALLAEVQQGGAGALAITGEAGVGKTRLLAEVADRARAHDVEVFAGGSSGIGPEIPFGLVVEALDAAAGRLGPGAQQRLGPARLDELGRVLPSVPRPGAQPTHPLRHDRLRSYEAVRALIEELTRQRSGALLLDDLQWADQASAELVAYLLRRGAPRTLLVLAYRSPAPSLLARATAHAARDGALEVVRLEPLHDDEVAELIERIAADLPLPTRDQLRVESGGNPFYLLELLELLGSSQGPAGPGLGADVPTGVRSAIAHELAQLTPAARALAHAAAVAGDPFEVELGVQVAGIDDAREARSALDELVTADTLRPTGTPGRLRFRHPIVRHAVYGDAGPGWRLEAHQRAADALGNRGAPLGDRAQHVLLSGPRAGDQAAVGLLVEAGLDAVPRTPTAAAAWFDGAARRLADSAPVEQHLSVLTALAETLTNAGRLDESRAALDRALRLAPRAEQSERAARRQLSVARARLERLDGSGADARSVIVSALAEAEPASTEVATLTLHLAHEHMLAGGWEEAVSAADAARTLAAALGDDELLDRATAAGASYRSWGATGTVDEARRLADEVAARLDARADHDLALAHLDAYALLCLAELNLERWAPLEAHAERAIGRCRETGEEILRLFLVQTQAMGRMMQGRLAEARQGSDAIVEAEHRVYDFVRAQILSSRSWLLSRQGQLSAALAAGQDALDATRRGSGGAGTHLRWMAHVSHGIASIEAGQHEAGVRRLLAAGGDALTDVPPAARTHALRYLAEAAVELDRLPLARAAAEQAEEIATQLGLATRIGDANHARAVVHLAADDPAAAADAALAAAWSYECPGAVVDAARSRTLAATALLQTGAPGAADAAIAHLEQAHATFAACGAAILADRAARLLGDLGVPLGDRRDRRPDRAAAATGPSSLSRREREVAALVTRGYTNRQIAEELFVSRKTVETHLAHIFAKLGVSRRAAMVEALRDR